MKIRIAIFASGGGSNAMEIIRYFRDHDCIEVAKVFTNNPSAGVITVASEYNIPCELISNKLEESFLGQLDGLDILVLAGYLRKIPAFIINAFPGRIVNIHPALLPKYGGKGMYGHHVHAAVLQNKDEESGITVHLVDEQYDHGEYLLQEKVPVLPHDTDQTLAARVLQLEHRFYPQVIEKLALSLSGKTAAHANGDAQPLT